MCLNEARGRFVEKKGIDAVTSRRSSGAASYVAMRTMNLVLRG